MPERTLDVSADHLAIVKAILRRHVPDREVWSFGSRVYGGAKPTSDLDLVVLGDESPDFRVRGLLTEAFEESNLPWKVDVLWWTDTAANFRRIIEDCHLVLQPAEQRAA